MLRTASALKRIEVRWAPQNAPGIKTMVIVSDYTVTYNHKNDIFC